MKEKTGEFVFLTAAVVGEEGRTQEAGMLGYDGRWAKNNGELGGGVTGVEGSLPCPWKIGNPSSAKEEEKDSLAKAEDGDRSGGDWGVDPGEAGTASRVERKFRLSDLGIPELRESWEEWDSSLVLVKLPSLP